MSIVVSLFIGAVFGGIVGFGFCALLVAGKDDSDYYDDNRQK